MKHPPGAGYSRDQQMMSFSAIAYESFDSISDLQTRLDAADALDQEYVAIWLGNNRSNILYIAKKKTDHDYIIAISGSPFRFTLGMLFDLYENFRFDHQVSMPYSRPGDARVTTLNGLSGS